ncbi:unnamed protein product [Orchesella dallaii]|uniref:Uncharacterized protein n=1 Tax=Orchesella dallaii TaxID=48710 RepID=A0ABP1S9D1_9HEXA
MTSSNRLPLYWGRYKLNRTKVLDVEPATKLAAENNQVEIELKNISDENSNVTRRIGNDFIISVSADPDPINSYPYIIRDSQILQTNFNFMNNVGLSPSKYDGNRVSLTRNIFQKDRWTLISIWTLNFAGALVLTIFGFATISSGWSWEVFMQLKSYQFGRDLLVWTSNSTEFRQIVDDMYDEYQNVTTFSAFFAISNAVLEFYGHIYDSAATDVLLLAVITMFKLINDFKFEKVLPTQPKEHFDVVWMHFRQLQSISGSIDSAFGNLFKLIHLDNLITCGYYLQMLTTDTSFNLYFLLLTSHIFKVGLIYFIATKASSKNKAFRAWTQETYVEQRYIKVGTKRLKTSLVLDELTTKPIGIGSDNFHVDESFVIKVSAKLTKEQKKKKDEFSRAPRA